VTYGASFDLHALAEHKRVDRAAAPAGQAHPFTTHALYRFSFALPACMLATLQVFLPILMTGVQVENMPEWPAAKV
jgi:hypothetical protein